MLCSSLSNQLEPVSSKVCPEILKIKRNMLKSGADGAVMSGSGPTVYGLTQKERQARHPLPLITAPSAPLFSMLRFIFKISGHTLLETGSS